MRGVSAPASAVSLMLKPRIPPSLAPPAASILAEPWAITYFAGQSEFEIAVEVPNSVISRLL